MGSQPLRGKAVIGQSGGCTAVINQSIVGAFEEAKRYNQITRFLGALHGTQGLLQGNFIALNKFAPKRMRTVAQMPSAALGSSRHKLTPSDEARILDNLKRNDVRYLFLIGGNDTADTAFRLAQKAEAEDYEMRVIHIPKTIDNDLMETDHCPGYGSIGRFAAITTQEAGLDTKAMKNTDPVKFIEFMGRNSGWVTAASCLLKNQKSDPPHLILIPEVPFNENLFLSNVDQILSEIGYCVITLTETIRDENGNRIGAAKEVIAQDSFGHRYVEGAADYLAKLVERNFKVRARYDKPGTIQRMSMPYVSEVDQKEAYEAGAHAVRWAVKGISKVMVGFSRSQTKPYRISYVRVPLEKIPNRERYLPASFLNPERTLTNSAFKKYAQPLLGKRLPQFVHLF